MTHATETPRTDIPTCKVWGVFGEASEFAEDPNGLWVPVAFARNLKSRLAAAEALKEEVIHEANQLRVQKNEMWERMIDAERKAESALQSAWGEAREAAQELLRERANFHAECGRSARAAHWHEAANLLSALPAPSKAAPLAEQREDVSLDSIEQYRMQMAGISTASMGYWKEGDDIHPDYDTIALRDVAKLYAKYAELYSKHSTPAVQLRADRVVDDKTEREMLQLIDERDRAEEMADDLAAQIAAITGDDIGEHSSANDPWRNAMLAADEYIADKIRKLAAPTSPAAAKEWVERSVYESAVQGRRDFRQALIIERRKVEDRQAKIDALMLEYCPDEMTQEQKDNWAAHQQKVGPTQSAAIDAAITLTGDRHE